MTQKGTTSGATRRGFLGGSLVASIAAGCAAPATSPLQPSASRNAPRYGPPAGVAKLNANENPFGPSPKALEAMAAAVQRGAYYVDDSVVWLKAMIAERNGVAPEQITLSSGSSGVLTYLALAKTRGGGKILAPDLYWDTTSRMALGQTGGSLVRTPRTPDLGIDLDAMEAQAADVDLVHVTNPNNPTGLLLDGDKLRAFCRRVAPKTTVLIDEAYNELTPDPEYSSAVGLIREGYDVVVARTFSKIFGLAGMRVGYAISQPETAAELRRYGLGDYALNQAGIAAAVASYDDTAFIARARQQIEATREQLTAAVRAQGLKPLPSATNFVFVDLEGRNAEAFRASMADEGVLIRGIYGAYTHHSRVSMGTLEDVGRYIAALPRVLEKLVAPA
ncbi:MAG: histidinol-phosphate transaminase [Pseudomonadota bacterium]